ncbi:MAG: hypothetical protein MUO52_19465, partial [Desulfobacterales bacterium]|nr:hypothetical protein [Desulfobacterales bacterium]
GAGFGLSPEGMIYMPLEKFEIRISKFAIHPPQAGKNSNIKCPNDKNKITFAMSDTSLVWTI